MNILSTYLEQTQKEIDLYMEAHLPPPALRPARLHEAMHYSLFAGGKRLRPALCLAACEACSGSRELALRPASAVELFHTFTLIHDDLPAMDDDDLRRGRPTCHVQFDEATAILAGDALHTLAFEWLASSSAPSPYSPSDYVLELARAGGSQGVVGGQVEDMQAEGQVPTDALVRYIHTHKTADLFAASVRIGGISAGTSSEALKALTLYAQKAGLAFQITDDILNETSTRETLGKSVGNDREAGKATYVAVHGTERASQDARKLVHEATTALETLPGNHEILNLLAEYFIMRIK